AGQDSIPRRLEGAATLSTHNTTTKLALRPRGPPHRCGGAMVPTFDTGRMQVPHAEAESPVNTRVARARPLALRASGLLHTPRLRDARNRPYPAPATICTECTNARRIAILASSRRNPITASHMPRRAVRPRCFRPLGLLVGGALCQTGTWSICPYWPDFSPS